MTPQELAAIEARAKARDELEKLLLVAEVKRLRHALALYADPFGWFDREGNILAVPDFYSELDFGRHARAALTQEPSND
jgi:hypothetical protein